MRSLAPQKLPACLSVGLVMAAACEPAAPVFTQSRTMDGVEVPPEVLNQGHGIYATYCRTCHGDAGDGGGPAASGLQSPPTDLRTLKTPHDDLVDLIQAGRPEKGMPAWKGFRDEDLDAVARYVETLRTAP